MKTCCDCKQTLPLELFIQRKRRQRDGTVTLGWHCYCKPCQSRRTNAWHKQKRAECRGLRPAPSQIAQKKRRRRMRELIFQAYGHSCACCGEARYEFLAVDHINGGGRQHRKTLGKGDSGNRFYQWLINNKFPAGFRILCHNCNQARGHYGQCPHEREREQMERTRMSLVAAS